MNTQAFDSIQGQSNAVGLLRSCLARRKESVLSRCYLLSGPPGIGKTSIANAVVKYLGFDDGQVSEIRSGDLLIDKAREVFQSLQNLTMFGTGERILIVNEADKMTEEVDTFLMDALESLPTHSLVIFTTNYPDKLTGRFVDRCKHIRLDQPTRKELQIYVDGLCRESGKNSYLIPQDLTNYRRAKSLTEDYISGSWDPKSQRTDESHTVLNNVLVDKELFEKAKLLVRNKSNTLLDFIIIVFKTRKYLHKWEREMALRELDKMESA